MSKVWPFWEVHKKSSTEIWRYSVASTLSGFLFSCFVCFLECPNFNKLLYVAQLYDTEIANINWALSSSTTEVTLTCLFCHFTGPAEPEAVGHNWHPIFWQKEQYKQFPPKRRLFLCIPPPLDFQNFRRHCFKSLFHYGLHGRGSKSLVALFTSPRSFCWRQFLGTFAGDWVTYITNWNYLCAEIRYTYMLLLL